jgi:hypothetical protein
MHYIPSDLLVRYVTVIATMEKSRGLPEIYGNLDKLRTEIHDQIKAIAKANDKDISLELAEFVENIIK